MTRQPAGSKELRDYLENADINDLDALARFLSLSITETVAGNMDTKVLSAVAVASNVLKSVFELRDVSNKIKQIESMILDGRVIAPKIYVGTKNRESLEEGDGTSVSSFNPRGSRASLRTLGQPLDVHSNKKDTDRGRDPSNEVQDS